MSYLKEIKSLIEKDIVNQKKYNIYKNASLVTTNYEIGRLLVLAQGGKERAKYGDKLIKKWSVELTKLYGSGYGITNMKNMRSFYLVFEKSQPLAVQLTWTNITILLAIKDENKRNYYINMCIKQNLSKRKLTEIIKSNAYERLSLVDKDNIKLIESNKAFEIKDTLKNPIYIKETSNTDKFNEKALKKYILEQLEKFFIELGVGYTFVGSEYKLGNRYCDLLLFNYEYLCFVVVELKVRKIIPQDFGQIDYYMKYIDKNMKKEIFNKTIGIIITKEKDKLVISYCSNPNIYNTTYELM